MLHLIFSPIRILVNSVLGLLILAFFARILGCREIFTSKMDLSTVHPFSWGRLFRNYLGLILLCIVINIITAIL